jgi:predicted metal-dependent phosphotriesterase family hydrolase
MTTIDRRRFVKKNILAAIGAMMMPYLAKAAKSSVEGKVITVRGPISTDAMGFTLTHEHVLADFIGAAGYSKSRYDVEEVYKTALPFLQDVKKKGCVTFVDCSPAYLGRDVNLLKRLAQSTGLNILTNTGYYGAVNENFLPPQAYTESAHQLAARWINEFKDGIEGTSIKPGFIKTSVDKAPLTPTQRKIIEAAAITHLATGLTMAIHTGDGAASKEQLAILESHGVSPSARIWVHAQNEPDKMYHIGAAKLNSWVSFDGVNPETVQANIGYLKIMKSENLLHRVLISQDSGWYNVGEPKGGTYKPYDCVFNQFIPALKENKFTQPEIDQIFKANPVEAFKIGIRKI